MDLVSRPNPVIPPYDSISLSLSLSAHVDGSFERRLVLIGDATTSRATFLMPCAALDARTSLFEGAMKIMKKAASKVLYF